MIAGDLSTMALADVLQWVDATRCRAMVTVRTPDGGEAWLVAEERSLVACSPPPKQGALAAETVDGVPGPARRAVAVERLLDLFLGEGGTFELHRTFTVPDEAVSCELPLAFLLMEGLRLLDEWALVQSTYPVDAARLAATDVSGGEGALDAIDLGILRLAQDAPALGEARLVLGLSRATLLRRVHRLRQRGLVDVEGTPHGPDVEASIIDQAEVLMRQEQYAEAAHVFRTLLASNPRDARVASLLAESERLHIQACYRELRATDIISIGEGVDRDKLQGTAQVIIDCLPRPRAVAVLVLMSPLRELETLSTIRRLTRRAVLQVETAD